MALENLLNDFDRIGELNYEESIKLLFSVGLVVASVPEGNKEAEALGKKVCDYAFDRVGRRFGKTRKELTNDIMCSAEYRRLEESCRDEE